MIDDSNFSDKTETDIVSGTRLFENIQYPMFVIFLFMFLIVLSSTLKFLRMRSLSANPNMVPENLAQFGPNFDFYRNYDADPNGASTNVPPIYFIKSSDAPPSYDEVVKAKSSKV